MPSVFTSRFFSFTLLRVFAFVCALTSVFFISSVQNPEATTGSTTVYQNNVASAETPTDQSAPLNFDIVAYGGTSAAVEAARLGKSVCIIEPSRHLGGMSSSGLGLTDTGKGGGATAKFSVSLPDGLYDVMLCYASHENRATNITVLLKHAKGSSLVVLNERDNGKPQARSMSIAKCRFSSRRNAEIIVSNEGADGYVVVDAVCFVPVGE